MKIEERLGRRDAQDIIHIGNIVEACLEGEMGEIFRCLLNGRIAKEAKSQIEIVSAERRLGRIEMCQTLLDDLEQFIIDKEKMMIELRRQKAEQDESDQPVDYPVDPHPPQFHA